MMDSSSPFQPWAVDNSSTSVKPEREPANDAKPNAQENVNPKHTQTASYDKESGCVPSVIPGSSGPASSATEPVVGTEPKMDSAKISSMQQIVENTLSQEGRQRVVQLLEAVESLSGAERLLLYLRLPTGVPPHDPLKQPVNPLGSRAELQQTVTWIQTHLEVDPDVSLPKQDVYDEYIAHCMSNNMKPLSTADFGKVMKQVYPSVRPRRLGTRGNSRYCYAGLRKKIKLEVPQLPDLAETSREPSSSSRENERIVCDWAEARLGARFGSISELSRHLASARGAPTPLTSPSHAPLLSHAPLPSHGPMPPHASQAPMQPMPPLSTHLPLPHPQHSQHPGDEAANRQLLKHLKRKIQGTPGRPKKNKAQEVSVSLESPPGPSYGTPPAITSGVKHEGELPPDPYAYTAPYINAGMYERYGPYAPPPPPSRADYRPDPYAFEPPYEPHDLTRPPAPAPHTDPAHNLPINLSSDASLDLSTERADWQRRRPPEPPPPLAPAHVVTPSRLPLPGKKLILETYQNEQGRAAAADDYPCEYLPKKMRAAEIMGGKLAAARHAHVLHDTPSTSAAVRPEAAFLDDPKNLANRSTSTAAALAREEDQAASQTRPGRDPTPRAARGRRPGGVGRDACCGLDGINLRTGMICEEKHSEILNRERVISICNIDKHDLDDYLNEGNSQEHEEELLKYFQREGDPDQPPRPPPHADSVAFLGAAPDPHDEHSQGKSEKLSQLRELLAKNLKNQSGSTSSIQNASQDSQPPLVSSLDVQGVKSAGNEGAFRTVANNTTEMMNGQAMDNNSRPQSNGQHISNGSTENGVCNEIVHKHCNNAIPATIGAPILYNGNRHNEPQSPTTRTQQYDFVPISEGCHSPGFIQRSHSPTKSSKPVIMGGSLQTSPNSHSTAASPFVSPRNTPVPRSRLCSRPIPKLNGRKRRNQLNLGVADPSKPFAIPIDQKCIPKTSMCNANLKYCQPMSAPPSPNIITSQYKTHMFQCASGIPNGANTASSLNFLPSVQFRENVNGELAHPLSADPLSSEVSQFFQESHAAYRPEHDCSFRSQSVPLKQGMHNLGLLSYGNTPVGSVPPTPVPNEFCDFGSLGDTCDLSKAGLNSETLDKIYDAIDSSNDVLNDGTQNLLNTNDTLSNGCDPLPEPQILADVPLVPGVQLNSFIPGGELMARGAQFNHSYANETEPLDNVEEYLKRTNSIEFDLSDLVTEKAKYYNTSRSVPSTPLPFKRIAPNLQIDPRRSRELFAAEGYSNMSNGISSKSVPSTPQLVEERTMFSYSNRDFLINGNSVETCGTTAAVTGNAAPDDETLGSPLHDMDMLVPPDLAPAAEDLLADLDKIDATPYVDL